MAGLSLRHIYKRYEVKKEFSLIKLIKNRGKKTKQPKEFVAVKDFNMEIEDGEFIVFVGPSGCGKSTTLRMIAGLEDISDGELYIGDTLVNDVDPKSRDIAMVFQSYALYPHMTAYDNIAFGLKMRRVPEEKKDENGNTVLAIDKKKVKALNKKIAQFDKLLPADDEKTLEELRARKAQALEQLEALTASSDDNKAKIRELKNEIGQIDTRLPKLDDKSLADLKIKREETVRQLEYYSNTPVPVYVYKHIPKNEIDKMVKWVAEVLNIEEQLPKKPGEMSGGQRQRIALGRAIVRNPKVFLLDEPLSNLDAKLRAAMRAEIVKLHNRLKTTFIYVTHDQVEAMTMGTRIVVMKLGVVQQIDTPTNLFDYPVNKFVAGFIGTPQMNFFDVTIQRSGSVLKTVFENGQTVDYKLSELRKIDEKYLDGEEHKVTLGVRGEKIELAKDGLKTSLTIKEVLGDTTQLFVHLTEDSKDFIVCVSERADYNSGDTVYVKFQEKCIHLFDNETEVSIMSREIGNN